ncbi:TonB-dependent receptor [Sphingomonas sp. Root720]|uniref:TonB-dependent receptor n=1 Tax=Sphingomonas sp. Root720 TaxID=1736595 RepID=UPI001F43912F|nr:TonB-dependent receptor [Sphingomonas sp. Root720]
MSLYTLAVGSLLLGPQAALAQAAAAPAGEAPSANSIQDIVVTARKRSESLQAVPVSITAVTGDALARAGGISLADVSRQAPNLYFEKADASIPFVYIRGIGNRNFDPGTDTSIGIFVDGVYQARLSGLDLDLFDVDRIEVLRGPQGTIYGKNTIGGAISVTTREPGPEFRARAMAEVGRGETSGDWFYGTTGSISGQVGEGVYGSISGVYRQREGWARYLTIPGQRGGGNKNWGIDSKLKFDLGENASLKLDAFYKWQNATPLALHMNDFNNTRPVTTLAPGVVSPDYPDNPFTLIGNDPSYLRKRQPGGSATLNVSLDRVDLTSITAYQHNSLYEFYDADASNQFFFNSDIGEKSSQFSEELRATGTFGQFSGLVGLYYGQEKVRRFDTNYYGPSSRNGALAGGTLNRRVDFDLDTKSYAAFGQIDWKPTDQLTVTAGARYSRDRKQADYQLTNDRGPLIFIPYQLSLPTKTFTSFDPTASVKYQFTPAVMAYASFATGYKSGGFQYNALTPLSASQTVRPEDVKSYEVGIKSRFLDNRIRANLAVFRMDYSDLQTLRFITVNGQSINVINNAAKSRITGVELETQFQITPELRLTANYSHLNAKYRNYVFNATVDFSGNRMQFAPRNSFYIAADYDVDPFSLHVGYNWRSRFFHAADNNKTDLNSIEKPLGLLEAMVAYKITPQLRLSAFGNNLLDKRYRTLVINVTGFTQREVYASPRTVGLRLNFDY